MKLQADTKQYTIRGIPSEVDRALRQKAARRKRSLNQVIVEELTEATLGAKRKMVPLQDVTGGWAKPLWPRPGRIARQFCNTTLKWPKIKS